MSVRHVAACGVFLLVSAPALATPATDQLDVLTPPFAIWPIPRESKIERTRLLLTDAVIVVPEGDARAQRPGRLLAELIEDQFMVVIPVVVAKAPEGKTPIFVGEVSSKLIATAAGPEVSQGNPGPEGYLVRINADRGVIAGCDYRGALY